ncbi:MAG: hypothetical protein GY935_16885 [Gammaproteobacteria bacterium]|nr:hypothetical protein [Gammaproteobacteria bacterium]
MSSSPYNATGEYQPESTLKLPALFAWPPRPLNALRWVCFDMLFPWGFFYIALAFISWYYLTPSLASMTEFSAAWIAQIWLRNAALLTLVATGSINCIISISISILAIRAHRWMLLSAAGMTAVRNHCWSRKGVSAGNAVGPPE